MHRVAERKHLPQIERILNLINAKKNIAPITLKESTEHEDTKLSFDAITSLGEQVSIRIRDMKYFPNFKDVTIRAKASKGGKTEVDKLRDGLGDKYFYCWEDAFGIRQFIYYDINRLRPFLDEGNWKDNSDTTSFRTYSLSTLKRCNSLIALTKSVQT